MMEHQDVEVLKDFDQFFYYGSGDLATEIRSDVLQNLLQRKRSLFYNRSLDSSGVKDYENVPNTIFITIMLPYDIVSSLAKRNSYVSNGEGDAPDRRIAISQATIRLRQDGQNLNINVEYINLFDLKQKEISTSLSLSGGAR